MKVGFPDLEAMLQAPLRLQPSLRLFTAIIAALFVGQIQGAVPTSNSLPIAQLSRTQPVDFESEILPVLRESCLACHNQTKAKADLILETPATILKGGESGPAVVPGQPADSLIFRAAAHFEKPFMPPKDNKANAPDLNPSQLALLQRWIEQGARGEVRARQKIAWQPLRSSVRPILSLALSSDSQFAAFGQGNELFVYQLPTGRATGPVCDPSLKNVNAVFTTAAHLDLIESVDFSPDGEWIATGSYREVKLWRRQQSSPAPVHIPDDARILDSLGAWVAVRIGQEKIEIWSTANPEAPKVRFETQSAGILLARIAPDGSGLAAITDDHSLRVWKGPSSAAIETKLDHTPTSIAWFRDGQTLVLGAGSEIQLLAFESKGAPALATRKTISAKESVRFLECLGNHQLVTAGTNGIVRVLNSDTGEELRSITNSTAVTALATSPDGRSIATANSDKTVRIWNGEDGKLLHEFRGEYHAAVRFQDAERAFGFGKNLLGYRESEAEARDKDRLSQTERVRKASDSVGVANKNHDEKEKQIATLKADEAAAEKSLAEIRAESKSLKDQADAAEAELAKAKALASETAAKALEARLAAQAAEIRHQVESALSAAVSGTPTSAKSESKTNAEPILAGKFLDEIAGKSAAAALAKEKWLAGKVESEKKEKAADEKLKAARKAVADAGNSLKPLQLARAAADNELQFAITAAQKTFDLLAEAQNALQLAQSDFKRLESARDAAAKRATEAQSATLRLAFSPDGETLASLQENGFAILWSTRSGAPLDSVATTNSALLSFANTNELLLASEMTARIWNSRPEWKFERSFGSSTGDSPFADRVNAVKFSPDGQFLATGGGDPSRGGELKLWRMRDGQLEHDFRNLHSDVVLSLAFSPDGRYLASGAADRFAKVTEVATGKLIRTLEGHTHHVLGVAWKRDGHTLMTAGADNVVKVWDAFSGEKKKNIEGFNKEVTAVAWIAESDQALACSGDNTVRLIKENGEKVRSFEGAADFLQSAVAAPDGRLVLAGGQDGVLRIWQTDTGKLLASWPEKQKLDN